MYPRLLIYFDYHKDSINIINNITFISLIHLEGCLIVYPCNTVRFIKNTWYD